jgi:23S rRNA pseudouridine2605 synthase
MSNEKSQFFKKKPKAGKPKKEAFTTAPPKPQKDKPAFEDGEEIRLNRYIANAGVCSRREADSLIEKGIVKVNGKVVTEMGYKVKFEDSVICEGRELNPEQLKYVLLNKPKDFLTTTKDELDRRTVMDLVKNACGERIKPVGRLDRNTTGLLLFTNDGELANKLTHPSGNIRKVYQATLDKPFEAADFEKLSKGIELEDGMAKVDDLSMSQEEPNIVGLEVHIGRNRIVRRMFEFLGYEVLKLDRTTFAGLTKKDLPRGKYRHLKPNEVNRLKMLGTKKKRS